MDEVSTERGPSQRRGSFAARSRMFERRLAARKLAQGVLVAVGLVTTGTAEAQFPIVESFQNSTAPGWSLLGNALLTSGNPDPMGQGWLRLTNVASDHEAGSAIYDTPFPSSSGMVLTFTYATYGGSGADGFSFYLLDGATSAPTVGAVGGSLGYSAALSSCGGPAVSAGVTNGYLGVGFDEWGNFSNCLYGPGGLPDPLMAPNAVAIRGSGSGLDSTGFRYLTGRQISGAPFDQNIETGSRAGARPVRISIVKQMIKVEIDFGSGYQTVVDLYDLSTAPGQAALPASLEMGLSASTGFFTNYHEFRNLAVTEPAILTMAHAAAPSSVSVGGTVTYTVTVGNDDTNGVNGVAFSDPVPAGIAGVTWTATTAGGATVSSASGSGNAITTTLNLPKSSSVTFTVTGTASAAVAGTSVTNAASVTPPSSVSNLGNSSASASVVVSPCVPVLQLAGAGQTLRVPLEPGGTWVTLSANAAQPCGGTPALSWLPDRIPAGAVETTQGNEYSVFIPEQAYPSILANADLGGSVTAEATGPSGTATATVGLLLDPSALLHVEQSTDRAALAPGDLALLTTTIRSSVSVTLPQVRLDDLLDGLDEAGPAEVEGAALVALEASAGKVNVTLDAVAGGGVPVTVRLPVRLTYARGGLSLAHAVTPPSGAPLSPQVAAQLDPAVPPGCGCTHGGGAPAWPLLIVLLCAPAMRAKPTSTIRRAGARRPPRQRTSGRPTASR